MIQTGEQYNGKLGLYTITKPLKIGGMGEVVEATNQNGEEVVVKFPATHDENGVVYQRRYIRDLEDKLRIEASVLKNFVHSKPQSIVNYLDESNDPNNYFLVMEKVDGETVGQKIAGSNPLSENEIIRLSVDVLRGLEFLHKHNTIYRDMKPPNIMIRKNGSAVLIDFGTAKQGMTKLRPQQNISMSCMKIGSSGWTCPDQEIGRVSTECDLYALGRVIFYMASGIQPFTISTVAGKMKKKLHQINSTINRQFSELVNDMIDPQHNKVHTASEVISQLNSVSTSKPVYSKPQRLQAQVYPQTTPAYALPEPKIILEGKDHKISNLADGTLIGKLHDECKHCNKLNYGTNIPVGWKCPSGCRCDLNPAHMIGAHHMRIYRDKGQIYVVNNDPERNSAINTAGRWRRMKAHRPEVLRDRDQVALLYNERKGPYMSLKFHTQ